MIIFRYRKNIKISKKVIKSKVEFIYLKNNIYKNNLYLFLFT